MNEQNLKRIIDERLEHGRKLRESTTLIKCLAIVEYKDGTNWQDILAHIPPEAINPEGYVEEVWIAPEDISIDEKEVKGKVHFLLSSTWLLDLNNAKIDRFVGLNHEFCLLPSPQLVVKYRIDNLQVGRKT